MADTPITVTQAVLTFALPAIASLAVAGVTQAELQPSPSAITLTSTVVNTPLAVTGAALTLVTSTVVSSAVAGVTQAELQPAASTATLGLGIAANARDFDVDGSFISTNWVRGDTLDANAAFISIQTYDINLFRAVPVVSGAVSLAGQNILFQESTGPWNLPVVGVAPTITPQVVTLEDNHFFVTGSLSPAPQQQALGLGAVVVGNPPTIAGSTITFIWGDDVVTVLHNAPSVQGQDVTLSKTWSLAVDASALAPQGLDVVFDYQVLNAIIVEPARFSIAGSTVVFDLQIPIVAPFVTLAGSEVGRGWGTVVERDLDADPTYPELVGSEVELLFEYLSGYAFSPAECQITGKDVVLFLGSGAPTRFRSSLSSNKIQIAFSKPLAVNYTVSESIRG